MQELLSALAWNFIHSLWQGLIIASFAALLLLVTPTASPRHRYNVLCLLFGCLIIVIGVTFTVQLQKESDTISIIKIAKTTDVSQISRSSPDFMNQVINIVNTNANVLMLVWTFFFLLNTLKISIGIVKVNRLRKDHIQPLSIEWINRFETLKHRFSIKKTIELLQSERINVPVTLGFFKPVVLLPIGLIARLPVDQVEAILLHELGHIKRNDYLVNFLQHLVEAVFFFNPALMWISSLIRQEREACCDDFVVASAVQKANYLKALISFEHSGEKQENYVLSIYNGNSQLLNRAKRLITNRNQKLNFSGKFILLFTLIIFTAFTYFSSQTLTFTKVQSPQKEDQTAISLDEKNIKKRAVVSILKKTSQKPSVKAKPITLSRALISPNDKPIAKHQSNSIGVDTISVKFALVMVDSVEANVSNETQKPVVNKKAEKSSESEKALQQIIKIKEEIGMKKESIGKKKDLLLLSTGKDKDLLLAKIKIERDELEKQREELDEFRAEYYSALKRKPAPTFKWYSEK